MQGWAELHFGCPHLEPAYVSPLCKTKSEDLSAEVRRAKLKYACAHLLIHHDRCALCLSVCVFDLLLLVEGRMAGYLFSLPEDFFDELSCISNGAATETENPTAINRFGSCNHLTHNRVPPCLAACAAKLSNAKPVTHMLESYTWCMCRDATAEDHAAASSTPSAGWSEGMGATCIACGIGINSQGFTSSAEQRQHFKTDWHR